MNKWALVIGAILILGAAAYYFVEQESFTTFQNAETSFGYKTTEKITKIVITEPDGWKIKLQKQEGDFWTVNDFYLAREDALGLIFETLRKIKVDKPMPLAAQANLNKDIDSKGKLIEVYTSSNEPTRAFKIYGSSTNRQGTFMKMEGSQTPYLVHIPGFIGSMDIRFHTVLEKWRSHRIFAGTVNEIKQLNVEFNEKLNDSYSITINNGKYEVSQGNKVIEAANLNTNKVKYIIESLPKTNIEAFDNLYTYKDSLLQQKPYCKIQIVSKFPQQSQTLVVYNMPLTDKSKIISSLEGEQKYDVDRFYATMNKNEDLVIIQQYVFEEILSKYSDFVKPQPQD